MQNIFPVILSSNLPINELNLHSTHEGFGKALAVRFILLGHLSLSLLCRTMSVLFFVFFFVGLFELTQYSLLNINW